MTFSLDTPTLSGLKAEARALREERSLAGAPISQGAALEATAKAHGFRDWNTASAKLPERIAVPFQVGQRVRGTYLGKPFDGLLMGVQLLADMQHFQVTVRFDRPVNVSKFASMVINRQRVVATVDVHGVSSATTSDGQPHMRLLRA